MNTLYKLKNINLNYLLNGNNIKILKNINFEIKKNESVAIIGESGSGKTSLLMLMSGLENPTNGSIVFNGEDLSKISDKRRTEIRKKKIGLILVIFDIFGHIFIYFNNGKSIFKPVSSFWQIRVPIRSIFDHFMAISIF